MLTTQQLSRIYLPLSFSKRSNFSASLYEIINSYLKLFPTNKIVFNTHSPLATATLHENAGEGAAVTIDGNRYAGEITFVVDDETTTAGLQFTVNLQVPAALKHFVVLTPADADAAQAEFYTTSTTTGFQVYFVDAPADTTFKFNYAVYYK
jgi:hypothetical protein